MTDNTEKIMNLINEYYNELIAQPMVPVQTGRVDAIEELMARIENMEE